MNIQYDETVIYNGMFIPIMSISELYIRNKKYTFYNQDSIVTITDILKPTENITLYTYSDKTIFGIQHETVKHNIKYIARVTFDLVKQPKKAKYTFKTIDLSSAAENVLITKDIPVSYIVIEKF